MIVAAAIRLDGIVYSLAPPAGHHVVRRDMVDAHGIDFTTILTHADAGFLTDTGKFLTRTEASRHAEIAGQIPPRRVPRDLLSTDLWAPA
jgi:hypothetical protein